MFLYMLSLVPFLAAFVQGAGGGLFGAFVGGGASVLCFSGLQFLLNWLPTRYALFEAKDGSHSAKSAKSVKLIHRVALYLLFVGSLVWVAVCASFVRWVV
jgi:uncharacterized membrane protein